MKLCVLGAGTWGTALAITLCQNHEVFLWTRDPLEARTLSINRQHPHLDKAKLPDELLITSDMKEAVGGAKAVFLAVPSVAVREVSALAAPYLKEGAVLVCAAKGLEPGSLFPMSSVIKETTSDKYPVVAFSGPTHAEEVAKQQPSLIVAASKNTEAAELVQQLFLSTAVRPYTSEDVIGVELCGALKNIIALSCGIATGLGYGDNTRAALITRGMAEITRLGREMGADERTFFGLAGIGDLIVTATSSLSRNNQAGKLIGQGLSPKEAIDKVGMVVEGINALAPAVKLAQEHGVDTPIMNAAYAIIYNSEKPLEAVEALLSREMKAEDL
ncbi:MAG TPA: NAD(P)-dependent glycerol-3-phosphate dehydrogenase [Clostridiales bacterium]|nr:NAD(P)-dependent glycerol-3-phosphate dehydrogenase [Clostridiales bacterium]